MTDNGFLWWTVVSASNWFVNEKKCWTIVNEGGLRSVNLHRSLLYKS